MCSGYDELSKPIHLELNIIEVADKYQRQGVGELICKFIFAQSYPQLQVLTGSTIDVSLPIFSKSRHCKIQYSGYSRNPRVFLSKKNFAKAQKNSSNGFSISIDDTAEYFLIKPYLVNCIKDFPFLEIEEASSLHNTYVLEQPIMVEQNSDIDYKKKGLKLTLFYNGEQIGQKYMKNTSSVEGTNLGNIIFCGKTCIFIGFIDGELGETITDMLSERLQDA